MTDTLLDLDLDAAPPQADDHEPEAHVFRQSDIAHSLVSGEKVPALCGKLIQVKMLQPSGLPVCEPCMKLMSNNSWVGA